MADIRALKRKMDLCYEELGKCINNNDQARGNEMFKKACDYKCLIADEILFNGDDIFEKVATMVEFL